MMSKQNVHELRFPEFSGEWEEKSVGDHFEFKNGLNKGKEYFGSGTPIVNFKDVFNNRAIYSSTLGGRVTVTEKEKELYSVHKGDLFFTRTSEIIEEIGMPSVVMEEIPEAVFSGFVLRARKVDDSIDDYFKKYVFSTNYFRKEMIKKSSMTTRALTSGTAIKTMKFNLPLEKKEQRKIGDFFTKLDRLIELEEKKLELLEEQKKGYMQKIFSQELRFKDENGNDYPEWEVGKLGNIATIHRGLTYKPSDISKDGVRVLRSSNIVDNTFYLHRDDIFINEEKVKLSFVKKNDILITAANGSPRLVGKNALINENIEKAVPGGFMYLLKSEAPKFVKVWMETREYKKMLTMVQGGNGSIGNLSRKDLEHAKITLPIKEEREKIGEFFMNFEKLSSKHKDRLIYLQKRKQSFLQKMFI